MLRELDDHSLHIKIQGLRSFREGFEMSLKIALQTQDTDAQLPPSLYIRTRVLLGYSHRYHPRGAICSSGARLLALRPTIGSPRSRETSARIAASWKCVVALTMALA